MEVWKAIPGYEGAYEASNTGLIRSVDRMVLHGVHGTCKQKGRVLKYAKDAKGYPRVALSDGVKLRTYTIHRLIAYTFMPPRPEGFQINHINGIKTDNSIGNLEYCTQSENALHSFRLGLQKPKPGSTNHMAKLTEDQVKTIRSIAARGGRYYGRKHLAERFGVSECTIKEVVTRRKNGWKHV
jgi:hypothetical protein